MRLITPQELGFGVTGSSKIRIDYQYKLSNSSTSHAGAVRRPQFCDEPQNLLERLPWDSGRARRPTVLVDHRRKNGAVFPMVCNDPTLLAMLAYGNLGCEGKGIDLLVLRKLPLSTALVVHRRPAFRSYT